MTNSQHFKISELSAASNLPISTIKFYIREGIIPKPIKTGKTRSFYTQSHLKLLTKIRQLKDEKNLSLDEIKAKLKQFKIMEGYQKEVNATKLNRREKIIQAAIGVFRKKGYNKAVLNDIVTEAGVGRATFYNYFLNKEELFFECADKIFYELDREFINPDLDGIEDRLLERLKYFVETNPQMVEMFILIKGLAVTNPGFEKKFDQIIENLSKLLIPDIDKSVNDNDIQPVNSAFFAIMLLAASEYAPYLKRKLDYSLDELFNDFWKIMLNGLKT